MSNAKHLESRSIRVFISSTFQDMNAERDFLMKRVFPRLKMAASKRDVSLTELDLRWGITEEESQTGKVVNICLKEIENSVPFFIGILGNRYGWIPEEADLDGSVSSNFPQVKNYLRDHLSVTEMEMQFGVLEREEDMHALFFLRDFEYTHPCDENENPEAIMKLQALKEAVLSSRYPSYRYESLENLGAMVEQSFMSLLDSMFPERNMTPHQKDRIIQDSFINRLCATYIKDRHNFEALDGFVTDKECQFLVLTGDSGLGKSSLLANWSRERKESIDYHIITYFSSNGGNQSHTQILRYLVDELCECFCITPQEGNEKKQLEAIYESLAMTKERIVIVLDAINQIADAGKSKMLGWLPLPPPNIKYIFSTLKDDMTMEIFEGRRYPFIVLHELSIKQRKSLVRDFLRSFGKKLTESQVQRIASSPLCRNTLVLRTLLEELIANGLYETIDAQIQHFLASTDVEDFYGRVIERYEQDYSFEMVSLILGLIAVSRDGLTEDEIIEMTGIKRYVFSDFFCGFSTHLCNQSGRYVFTHSHIQKTVMKRYIDGNGAFERLCREKIVETSRDDKWKMAEIPYQLDKLEQWDHLHDYIVDIDYLYYMVESNIMELSTYWRHILQANGDRYSLRDYNEKFDGSDRRHFDSAMIRLSDVTCLEKIKREYVEDLRKIIDGDPTLGTAFLYNLLARCFPEGNIGTDYAKKSMKMYKDAGDIEGELSVYGTLSGLYYHKTIVFHENECLSAAQHIRQQMLELGRSHYGEFSPIVMTGYQELCINSDDLLEGLQFGLRSIEVGHAVYGRSNPALGRPYHYVGCIYSEMGQWEDALKYFRTSCELWTPAYGLHHEIMVSSYGKQSCCLINLGRFEEALECNSKCLVVLRNTNDEDSHDSAVTHSRRGEIYRKTGQYSKALNEYLIAREILEGERIRDEQRSKSTLARVNEHIDSLKTKIFKN